MDKCVFYIVYLGQHMAQRIQRLCQLTDAIVYDMPGVQENDTEEAVSQSLRSRTADLCK